MVYGLVAGVFALACLVVLVAVPRPAPRKYVEMSSAPAGERAIQRALEDFLLSRVSGNGGASGRNLEHDELDELRERVVVLKELVDRLAHDQLMEPDIYFVVVRVLAVLIGLLSALAAAVALAVSLAR